MTRAVVSVAVLFVLLCAFGAPAAGGPGGRVPADEGRPSGPSLGGDRPAGGERSLPPAGQPPDRDRGRGPGSPGIGGEPVPPVGPVSSPEATPRIDEPPACRANSLHVPRFTPGNGGSTTSSAPQVHLVRHSIVARIADGIAIMEVDQTFRNDGGFLGEGAWTCPLPKGAAVTAFSISTNGVEHTGRFLRREEARRRYDEIVRKMRDPGLVQLSADGMVSVRVFPIPPRGEMRVRLTYAHPLSVTGSANHLVVALDGIVPADEPPLERLSASVEIESSRPITRVVTDGLPLAGWFGGDGTRWQGASADKDCRPTEDLEVGYLVGPASAPRLMLREEAGPDGARYLLAVVEAGREALHEVAIDFGRSLEVYPSRIGHVAPGGRVFICGRSAFGAPAGARLTARAGREAVLLAASFERGGSRQLAALWALRKVEELGRPAPSDEEAIKRISDLATALRVLTPYNAILAEE